jgi:hypothetical protein
MTLNLIYEFILQFRSQSYDRFIASPKATSRQGTCNGQNSRKTRQYKYKNVCVGCTERTLVVSIFRYCFVCLRCTVTVPMHYKLCLVTGRMEALQNWRPVRF